MARCENFLFTLGHKQIITTSKGVHVRNRDDWFVALRIPWKEVIVRGHGTPKFVFVWHTRELPRLFKEEIYTIVNLAPLG